MFYTAETCCKKEFIQNHFEHLWIPFSYDYITTHSHLRLVLLTLKRHHNVFAKYALKLISISFPSPTELLWRTSRLFWPSVQELNKISLRNATSLKPVFLGNEPFVVMLTLFTSTLNNWYIIISFIYKPLE